MSADNGVYILCTKGPEFRVAYAQNIDEIYGEFSDESYKWQGDPHSMLSVFGQATVFIDEFEAIDNAEQIALSYDYLEDGICLIRDFDDWDFNRLKETHGQETESNSREVR
jgi:hypothetical protein